MLDVQPEDRDNTPPLPSRLAAEELVLPPRLELTLEQQAQLFNEVLSDSIISTPAFDRYREHLTSYFISHGLISAGEMPEKVTWEQLKDFEQAPYVIGLVRGVSQSLLYEKILVRLPSILPLLVEIEHGKFCTDSDPKFSEYMQFFKLLSMTIRAGLYRPLVAPVRWDYVIEILSHFAMRAPLERDNAQGTSDLTLLSSTIMNGALLKPDYLPVEFGRACAELLRDMSCRNYQSEEPDPVQIVVLCRLDELMRRSDTTIRKLELGFQDITDYEYNRDNPETAVVSDTRDSYRATYIKELLCPHFQETLRFTLTCWKRMVVEQNENDQYGVNLYCAAVLFNREQMGRDYEIQKLLLEKLQEIATSGQNVSIRALSKYHLFRLHRANPASNDMYLAYSQAFNTAQKDDSSQQSTLMAARQILSERRDPEIVHLLLRLIETSSSQKIKDGALITVNAHAQIIGDRDLINSLTVVANRRGYDQWRAYSDRTHIQRFVNEVALPFALDLKKADPNIAMYYRVKDDDQHRVTSSLINSAPPTLLLYILVDTIHDTQLFKEACEAFHAARLKFASDNSCPVLLHKTGFKITSDSIATDRLSRQFYSPLNVEFFDSLSKLALWRAGQKLDHAYPRYATYAELNESMPIIEPESRGIPHFDSVQSMERSGSWSGFKDRPSYKNLDEVFNALGEQPLAAYENALLAAKRQAVPLFKVPDVTSISLNQYRLLNHLSPAEQRTYRKILSAAAEEKSLYAPNSYLSKVETILVNIFKRADKIVEKLTKVEPREVIFAEIQRSIELLLGMIHGGKNPELFLHKEFHSKPYQTLIIYPPRNEPLFSAIERVILPSLITDKVLVRIPRCFKEDNIMKNLISFLVNDENYKSILPSIDNGNQKDSEAEFVLKYRNKIDGIVFSGSFKSAQVLLADFSSAPQKRATDEQNTEHDAGTLKSIFLLGSGEGHNPIIVAKSAELNDALVWEVVRAVTFNSGQNCTRPCSILVEGDIERELEFLDRLESALRYIPIGRLNEKYDVPIRVAELYSSSTEDIDLVDKFISSKWQYIYGRSAGAAVILDKSKKFARPTIFRIPLVDALGNYTPQYEKAYAPFFIVQRFDATDHLMSAFFTSEQYYRNAMYVSLFAREVQEKEYLDALGGIQTQYGQRLHASDSGTILLNKTLNSIGMDHGARPFGGYGYESKYVLDGDFWGVGPMLILDTIRYRMQEPM